MYLRGKDGFTLIEVLIVVLIIGILAAIAIPSFLGLKGKSMIRVMEANTKAMERELRMVMDHYDQQSPLVFSTTPGQEECFEHTGAKDSDTCATVYPDITSTGTYQELSDIISLYVQQQNIGLKATSPFDNTPLLTEDDSPASKSGHILLINTSDSTISISAWNEAGSELLTVRVSSH